MKLHVLASLTKRRQYIGSCRHAAGYRPASVLQKHGQEKRLSRAAWLRRESWTQDRCYSCQRALSLELAPCSAPFPKSPRYHLVGCKAPPVHPPPCTNAPPMHTAAHRVSAGFLTAMESTWPGGRSQVGLTIVADMINHRGEVGPKSRKKLDNFVKPLVHGIKAGPHGSIVRRDRTAMLLCAAFEHPVQVFRFPPEGHGQGFERAAATAALHGMPLDFAHDGYGHMRTLRELALTPAKLADTVADSPSDRSPVLGIAFRHAFLRAPLPAPRLAEHCAIPRQTGTDRNQTKAFRNTCRAEIISTSMISASRGKPFRGSPFRSAYRHVTRFSGAEREWSAWRTAPGSDDSERVN